MKDVQNCKRRIYFNSQVNPINYQNNLVKNTKYNIITFVPKVLYNQFKFFFNMFFLVTALTQLVEILRVGLFITFIGPLIMVLGLTMAKEAYDDYRTYLRDIEVII
jgi:phospholipid-translocating ATPase